MSFHMLTGTSLDLEVVKENLDFMPCSCYAVNTITQSAPPRRVLFLYLLKPNPNFMMTKYQDPQWPPITLSHQVR